ncbi:MAG: CatA-like O-acetyltransferase, family 2 [Gallintestinimicrobium sp.]
MPKEVDPKDTTRAAAYALWMKAPNPMVTFFKTFDVTNLIKVSRKRSLKFNMLLDYCIGRAAVKVKEFYILPVGDKLIQYDTIAVNTIVKNKEGEVSSCDLSYNAELNQFNEEYLKYTAQVAASCQDRDLSENSMVIGTSAIIDTEIDGAVGMNSGIFNNPFIIWGRYKKEMASVLPAPLFPVPSHADGRRTRRSIFEELAKRDQSVEIMAERKEYAYGRIGSDYAEIRCIGLGLNSCPGSGMAGRKSR